MEDMDSLARLRVCYGVLVPVPAGAPRTLRHFLLEVLGLTPAYAEERVQTILLDGLVVDGLDTPLYPGARLALSAAMPGVVGATLRKGGHYAPMRAGITLGQGDPRPDVLAPDMLAPDMLASDTLAPDTPAPDAQGFWVELRCFNDIAREVGPALLRRGVALPHDDLTPELRKMAAPLPDYLPPLPDPAMVWLPSSTQ